MIIVIIDRIPVESVANVRKNANNEKICLNQGLIRKVYHVFKVTFSGNYRAHKLADYEQHHYRNRDTERILKSFLDRTKF